jgi:plasmid stabilization system protein ParE
MRIIKWNKQSINQFNEAIKFIRSYSPQNAHKVKLLLLGKIEQLVNTPEIYSPDKYKINNKGDYRAFEMFRYRISYLVKEDEIIIARVRHTSMEPKQY